MKHSHKFPLNQDADTYLILQDYGREGLAWEETAPEHATREGCIRRLKEYATYRRIPVIKGVVCFNVVEGWSQNVTLEMLTESGFLDEPEDVPDRFDREASRADFQNDERAELVR